MNQSLFAKREHELKAAADLPVTMPEKGTRSAHEVAAKWSQIKLLRNLDVQRLQALGGTKILTQEDWMISALLALNRKDPKPTIQIKPAQEPCREKEKEEESKQEGLPTGDSSNGATHAS